MPARPPSEVSSAEASSAEFDQSSDSAGALKPGRDKVLVISILFYFVFLSSLWGLYRVGSPTLIRVTVYDMLAKPGEPVELMVKFEHEGPGLFDRDLKGVEVQLALAPFPGIDDSFIKAKTDRDGVARFEITAPARAGTYAIRTKIDDKAYDLLDARPAGLTVVGKPLLICDIDDTITDGGGWKLFVEGKEPTPLANAARVLVELSRSYQLVFLTARDDSLLEDTRRWLARHQFPTAPVVGRDWKVWSPFTSGGDKSKILAVWKQQFDGIAFGVGNSSGDRRAYRDNGVPHVILTGNAEDGPGRSEVRKEVSGSVSTYYLQGWSQVAQIIARDSASSKEAAPSPNPAGAGSQPK